MNFYVTGGVAFANFKRTATQTDLNTPGSETFQQTNKSLGLGPRGWHGVGNQSKLEHQGRGALRPVQDRR
jgi:hypothetical protein